MSQGNTVHRHDTEKISPHSKSLLHQAGMLWERANLTHTVSNDVSQSGAFRTLLVPLDGTLQAEHALPYALSIARRSRATVRLAHVHSRLDHSEAWNMHPSEETQDRRKREKQEYLNDVADRIARVSAVNVETILIDSFDTEESLLNVAESSDLVVMASRRRGFWRRLMAPSVTEVLRRLLRIPILLVRGYPSPVDLTADPIARHILVSLDGSPFAETILEPAKAIGRLDGAAVTLLNIQNKEWTSGVFEHTNPPGYLIGTARGFRDVVPVVDAQIVTTNKPVAAALASFAERRQFDLIAVATHADGEWRRWLRGSVIDSLLRSTDLPILTLTIDTEQKRPEVLGVVG
jgi:nucleotide-binding universal stress UspA family protein